jgi:hypothetical protein
MPQLGKLTIDRKPLDDHWSSKPMPQSALQSYYQTAPNDMANGRPLRAVFPALKLEEALKYQHDMIQEETTRTYVSSIKNNNSSSYHHQASI